ncbi:tripartite tricarboxylate transporter TctB family protein [Mesorhizobium sp. CAU 1741]|uniref:tripartite tricarboxylate transporter TctB family protein n=1 Tax=Mesorhizobium sp. CAU 1741 TaxID=3140366 RepID=UPI00325B03FF
MKVSQDAASGAVLTAIGSISLFVASGYFIGTARSMGPGYAPVMVSGLLVLVGIALLLRSRFVADVPVTGLRLRSTVMVLASIVVFGMTVEGLGSFLAVLLTLMCSAAGSARFRFTPLPILGAIVFSAACAGTFSVLLGLPMPVIGSWLQPLLFN